MDSHNVRKALVPITLTIVALILVNIGLYVRLSAQPELIQLSLPYSDTFQTSDSLRFPTFGGDWDVRDETLVQISTTGSDLGLLVPLNITPEQPYQFEADLRYIDGSMGGGIVFNSQNGNNRQQSQMARFNVADNALWLIYGYFGDDSNFQGQGSVQVELPTNNPDWQRLGVEVGVDTYNLLLNGNVVVSNIPLQYHGGTVGFITSSSQVAFDNVTVDVWDGTTATTVTPAVPVSSEQAVIPASGASILSDNFDTTSQGTSLWMPFSGEWQFADGTFVQSQLDGFDLSAGYNHPFGDVAVTITFHHLEGQGAGLLFNMAQPDSIANAQMVRYVHDDNFLMWGYFNADRQFTGQGSAPVPAAGTESHTLNITITGATYAITLDGQVLAVDTPVMTQGDYLGLVSAQSRAAFDNFEVQGAGSAPVITATEIPAVNFDMNAVTGEWTFGDTIVQNAAEAVDYIAGTGIAAETFRVSVTITLPTDVPDAGAGLVFHMNGREDIANGQMIRFGNGGSEIFWGKYDANRVFTGLGGAPLTLDWTQPHRLTLIVHADNYDVLVDDVAIVSSIPVDGSFGWIGLLSYRGTVTFSNFELSIGE